MGLGIGKGKREDERSGVVGGGGAYPLMVLASWGAGVTAFGWAGGRRP